jgi:predicted pyridoxine 5'-phosphate oxidase superfamily flavin-nucleotide-binding protein
MDTIIRLFETAARADRMIEGDADLQERLRDPAYPGEVEGAILFSVEAWDVNCPQHIHRRFSQRQIAPVISELRQLCDQ